jgi:hypothetical protein
MSIVERAGTEVQPLVFAESADKFGGLKAPDPSSRFMDEVNHARLNGGQHIPDQKVAWDWGTVGTACAVGGFLLAGAGAKALEIYNTRQRLEAGFKALYARLGISEPKPPCSQ